MRIGLWVVIAGLLLGLVSQLLIGPMMGPEEPTREPSKTEQQEPPSERQQPEAKLQNRLAELARADDPEAYARRHDLTYEDGLVQVVVEIGDQADMAAFNWAVEALEGRVETSYETRVQVRVPRTALMTLAGHPHVEFIRAPVRPRR